MGKELYLVVGASGSGKDYIVDKICKDFNKARVISRTTRKPRQGRDLHVFVDDNTARAELPSAIAKTDYNGYKYYVLPQDINEMDFYIIDVQGVKNLKKEELNREVITIFIDSPWYIRAYHMRKRGDSIRSIINRLTLDRVEFRNFEGDLNFKSSNDMYKHFLVKSCVEE